MKPNFKFITSFGRIVLIGAFIANFNTNSFSQVDKGIVVNFGLGTVDSRNLNKYMMSKKSESPFVRNSDAHGSNGGSFGIGGSFKYPLSDKLTLQSEITLNYHNSKLFINYIWDNRDVFDPGTKIRISSESSIKFFYLNIPLLLKYRIFDNKHLYFFSGVTLNLNQRPRFESQETRVDSEYHNGILETSTVYKVSQKSIAEKYNTTNVLLTLGLEKKMRRKWRNVSLSLRCNFTLNKSPFYTNNSSFYSNALNNKVLSLQGKSEVETQSGYKLNDFRMTNYLITVTYNFKKKSI